MIHPDLPLKALSIMQPWAWLIVNGHKDIENRDWTTKFRGEVAIHAGKKLDKDCAWEMFQGRHPASGRRLSLIDPIYTETEEPWNGGQGGIVGVAEISNCVDDNESEWFVGRYGFIIRNARPVDFIPVKGALGFFDWRKNL